MKTEERELLPAKWGLVNSWAKDASRAARAINARAETLATSPAFRDAYARRRCVVPTDGFYEWEGPKDHRQPHWIHRPDGRLVLMAGLYESWQPKPGEWQRTFTIVTTRANEMVARIHDRMPVVLDEEAAGRWMLANTPERELRQLLAPAPESALRMTAVSPRVNKVDNDDPAVLEPVAETARLL
jgi:putative SOS response-associated peptidase YedK